MVIVEIRRHNRRTTSQNYVHTHARTHTNQHTCARARIHTHTHTHTPLLSLSHKLMGLMANEINDLSLRDNKQMEFLPRLHPAFLVFNSIRPSAVSKSILQSINSRRIMSPLHQSEATPVIYSHRQSLR